MARRGFFAELQRQSRISQQRNAKALRESVQSREKAHRDQEKAARAADHARNELAKATAANMKQREKEAREAHLAQQAAEVEARNSELAQLVEDLSSILAGTLGVDDYVDLEILRVTAQHPSFEHPDLETALPPPIVPSPPPEPVLLSVPPPTGISALFGKGRHQKALAEATQAHAVAVERWKAEVKLASLKRTEMLSLHAAAETRRVERLAREKERYRLECETREKQAREQNERLDTLIVNLAYGTADAVQEYVSIVLANSVYPESFLVDHEFGFDAETAELTLKVSVPPPSALSEVKTYKYSKSSDEISATQMSQKECRERYALALQQVAIRSFHEVFEADRRGMIASIALEVGTPTVDPATGLDTYIPFIMAAASRELFQTFELSAVVPAATLERLGATISKNPYGLIAVDRRGVRRA